MMLKNHTLSELVVERVSNGKMTDLGVLLGVRLVSRNSSHRAFEAEVSRG